MKNLTASEKKSVIDSLNQKYKIYNVNLTISDSLNLQLNGIEYEVCSAISDKVKVLFVLFNSTDHSDKERIIKELCKTYGYDIGHSVHYQFNNNTFIDTVLSNEIS